MLVPPDLKPATWGVTHGSGVLGWAIRRAEQEMTKDKEHPDGDLKASWAGHCVVYVGEHDFGGGLGTQHAIVQAEWPRVRIDPVTVHSDYFWATGQTLSDKQRAVGTAKAMSLVDEHYDPAVYAYFLARVAGLAWSRDLTKILTDERWVICSGLMVLTQEAMGVNLGPLRTAAIQDPDFVSPADALAWGTSNRWMERGFA